MKPISKIVCNENLSEDLLSEGVASSKIPSSDKIMLNMNLKSLSNKKKTNELEFSFSNYAINDNFHNTCRMESIKKKKISLAERRKNSSYSQGYEMSPPQEYFRSKLSLKAQIRSLLKIAVKIRRREELKMNHQDLNQAQNNTRNNLENEEFVTMKDIKPIYKEEEA